MHDLDETFYYVKFLDYMTKAREIRLHLSLVFGYGSPSSSCKCLLLSMRLLNTCGFSGLVFSDLDTLAVLCRFHPNCCFILVHLVSFLDLFNHLSERLWMCRHITCLSPLDLPKPDIERP